MNTDNLNLFFKKLSEDNTMRDAFIGFAANYDVDLSELNEAELDGIAGGAGGSIVIIRPGKSAR